MNLFKLRAFISHPKRVWSGRGRADLGPIERETVTWPDHSQQRLHRVVGVALGLGAALSWGLADYFAAVASRSVGALRVVLGFHLAALIPLTVLVLATDALARVSIAQGAVFVLIGAVGWVSYLAFYGALAIGPISVLSPIVSGYAAVTVLLAVVFAGNRLTAPQAVAVAITIAGAMLASADIRAIAHAKLQRRSALGFVLALCAMALLGGFVFGVSYYRQRIGWLAPIFLARGFAALFVLGHVLVAGGSTLALGGADPAGAADPPGGADPAGGAEPAGGTDPAGGAGPGGGADAAAGPTHLTRQRRKLGAIMILLALLDTGGYVCFNLGVGHSSAAIVAAASAPYAIVPIAMGVLVLAERPTPAQWLGVGFVVAGVVVLGAVA
jgi:drug/metabolite transporter (DMT)-like permease